MKRRIPDDATPIEVATHLDPVKFVAGVAAAALDPGTALAVRLYSAIYHDPAAAQFLKNASTETCLAYAAIGDALKRVGI